MLNGNNALTEIARKQNRRKSASTGSVNIFYFAAMRSRTAGLIRVSLNGLKNSSTNWV